MRLRTLVWREIFERKNQLATSFLAILLGVTAIVSIKKAKRTLKLSAGSILADTESPGQLQA